MPDIVYLNGDYLHADEAKISVFDHGFLYGDGIFETMRSYDGRIFKVDEHIVRLFKGAARLELDIPLKGHELKEILYGTLEKNQLKDAYVRLTISRGEGPLGIDPRNCSKPTVLVTVKKLPDFSKYYEEGVKAVIVNIRRNLIAATPPELKSLNFLNNILAKLEANKKGAFEGIMLNYQDYVTEGTVSNIFIVKDGVLKTPAVEAGILPGITREVVLQIIRDLGRSFNRSLFKKEEIYKADEVFLTNSSMEIMPVTEVDGNIISDGKPGTVTKKLIEKYRVYVRETICQN